jgi:hypothetical protein
VYDPLKQNLFFKNEIEVFHSIPGPKMEEKTPQPTSYPKIVQVPTSPPSPRIPIVLIRQPEKSKNLVELWF